MKKWYEKFVYIFLEVVNVPFSYLTHVLTLGGEQGEGEEVAAEVPIRC